MSDKVIQLFKRPTLAEYLRTVKEWYEKEPAISLMLIAERVNDGEGYELAYYYEADSDEDFINILENIIKDVKED